MVIESFSINKNLWINFSQNLYLKFKILYVELISVIDKIISKIYKYLRNKII